MPGRSGLKMRRYSAPGATFPQRRWILLPLAIYPLYGAIRRSNRQLQLLNIKIDQMVKNQIEKKEPL